MDSQAHSQASYFSLKGTLFFSLLSHGVLLAFLFYTVSNSENEIRAAGEVGHEGLVMVSIVGNRPGTRDQGLGTRDQRLVTSDQGLGIKEEEEKQNGPTGVAEAGEGGTSEILRQIRGKIEREKFYPLVARRQGIAGAPVVEFKINNDGSVEYIRLQQTSGSEILDRAAQETIQRAQPYPSYPDPISLSIGYALADKF